jgi:hypothetical protein
VAVNFDHLIPKRHYMGLDLGKQESYAALSLLAPEKRYARRRYLWEQEEEYEAEHRKQRPEIELAPSDERAPRPVFKARQVERIPLGSRFHEVAGYIAAMLASPKLKDSEVELVIDASGVGSAVAEILEEAGVRYFEWVSITSGRSEGSSGRFTTVPKNDLISTVEVAFQRREIPIPRHLSYAPELVEELEGFRQEETAAGNLVYRKKSGAYDDLIISLSLALRAGRRGERFGPPPDESLVDTGRGLPFRGLRDDELFTINGPVF